MEDNLRVCKSAIESPLDGSKDSCCYLGAMAEVEWSQYGVERVFTWCFLVWEQPTRISWNEDRVSVR